MKNIEQIIMIKSQGNCKDIALSIYLEAKAPIIEEATIKKDSLDLFSTIFQILSQLYVAIHYFSTRQEQSKIQRS